MRKRAELKSDMVYLKILSQYNSVLWRRIISTQVPLLQCHVRNHNSNTILLAYFGFICHR